ncbi:MAG: hypothetical protein HFG40_02490 [Bacilli bacterium]|nr:hypothetical protein [Bacilli bacterium]
MNFILLINFDQLLDPIRPYFLQLGILFGLLFCLTFLGLGAVFKRAGKSAIAAWIPFYNLYVLFEIVYQKGWKVVFLLVPFYNLYLLFCIPFKLSKMFGHSALFGLYLLLFPVGGYPILGFEDAVCGEEIDPIEDVVSEPIDSNMPTVEKEVIETPDLDSFENKSSFKSEVPVMEIDANLNSQNSQESMAIEPTIIEQEKNLIEDVAFIDSSMPDDNILADIESMISPEPVPTEPDVSEPLSLNQSTSSTDSSVLASELSFLDSILSSK